ncbi:MAG TPA: hypothetical protein VK204_00440 [Nocardioidaceae bacterium]|nr:hypothetical protein [Nocardioidaceae bacterium]
MAHTTSLGALVTLASAPALSSPGAGIPAAPLGPVTSFSHDAY